MFNFKKGRQRDAILVDNLETKSDSPISNASSESAYFTETDFGIGKELSIVGRKVLLFDCDEFTRRYYKANHDMGNETDVMIFLNIFAEKFRRKNWRFRLKTKVNCAKF
jgi:hypothetical protein